MKMVCIKTRVWSNIFLVLIFVACKKEQVENKKQIINENSLYCNINISVNVGIHPCCSEPLNDMLTDNIKANVEFLNDTDSSFHYNFRSSDNIMKLEPYILITQKDSIKLKKTLESKSELKIPPGNYYRSFVIKHLTYHDLDNIIPLINRIKKGKKRFLKLNYSNKIEIKNVSVNYIYKGQTLFENQFKKIIDLSY